MLRLATAMSSTLVSTATAPTGSFNVDDVVRLD